MILSNGKLQLIIATQTLSNCTAIGRMHNIVSWETQLTLTLVVIY